MRRMSVQSFARRWCPALLGRTIQPRDETTLFSEEQIAFLAERDLIYLTEKPNGQFSTIIAADFNTALDIAARRRVGESVIGLMGFGFLRHVRTPTARTRAESRADANTVPPQYLHA